MARKLPEKPAEPVKRRKCECNGMSFICNRWVFTGECQPGCPRRGAK